MGKETFVFFPLLLVLALSLSLGFVGAASTLQPGVKLVWHYYKVHNTCDNAETFIKYQVKKFWDQDKSITPKLLRLLYSDCFVNVCTFFSPRSCFPYHVIICHQSFVLCFYSFYFFKEKYCSLHFNYRHFIIFWCSIKHLFSMKK